MSELTLEEYGREIVDKHERLLFAEALIGHDAQLWLKSQTGRFIAGRAKEEITEFLEWAMSPEANAQEFEARRAKAVAARTLMHWTIEQIQAGSAAEHAIEQSNL